MMRGGDKGGRVMAGAMAVVAGRAARPCDVCGRKRARWYCAADEAYLCEACDGSVHAANALALRHERVRLAPNGAPMKMERRNNINISGEPLQSRSAAGGGGPPPPSGKRKLKSRRSPLSPSGPGCVPQLREVKLELTGSDANSPIDPSDDHFTAEELTGNANLLDEDCCPSNDCSAASGCNHHHGSSLPGGGDVTHDFLLSDPNEINNFRGSNRRREGGEHVGNEHGSEIKQGGGGGIGNRWMDLDLGNRELNEDNYGVELGSNQDLSDDEYCLDIGNNVDLSDDEYCVDLAALRGSVSADQTVATYARPGAVHHNSSNQEKASVMVPGLGGSRAGKPFKNIAGQSEWVKMEAGGVHYNPTHMAQNGGFAPACKMEGFNDGDVRQVPSLRLDYADVLSSWPDRGMLWTSDGHGNPDPRFGDDSNSGGCYDSGLVPDFVNGGGAGHAGMYGPGGGMGDDGSISAGNAREARVIRYREKRRTRLFSKKIRYEVRKLNAERRPRMKGRFVKRSPGRD